MLFLKTTIVGGGLLESHVLAMNLARKKQLFSRVLLNAAFIFLWFKNEMWCCGSRSWCSHNINTDSTAKIVMFKGTLGISGCWSNQIIKLVKIFPNVREYFEIGRNADNQNTNTQTNKTNKQSNIQTCKLTSNQPKKHKSWYLPFAMSPVFLIVCLSVCFDYLRSGKFQNLHEHFEQSWPTWWSDLTKNHYFQMCLYTPQLLRWLLNSYCGHIRSCCATPHFLHNHKKLWRVKGLLEIIVSFEPDSLAIHMIPRDHPKHCTVQ